MADQYISLRNIKFLLYEVFDIEKLGTSPYFKEHNKEIYDMLLDSALEIGDKYLRPINIEMDRDEPQLVDGQIRVHPNIKEIIRVLGEGGWISAPVEYEYGGQQIPIMLNTATTFIFNAANYSASVFAFLTSGAAGLVKSFASQTLKDIYLPKMYSGEWQGTMALTEPGAGSSLSDIATSAAPTDKEGVYKIKGQKIFISAGDHDATDNHIHLMLAKIKGGPAGAKGISLFIVPKKRIKEDGTLASNDLQTAGIFHKMGYKGAPIAHLMMGANEDCEGYLVGEPHKGLSYMFQMMNEARIGVGLNAAGIASAAYYDALKYTRERPQGRKIDNKDITLPQVNIIEHADVKRMLLFQKSIVEGSLSLLMQCSLYVDMERLDLDHETKENYSLLLDFLTPIAKTYPSEMGILSTSAAIQCLGGYGYCRDYTVEQYFRESRIHPIHEGTTAIHGLDLLGRKMTMHNGKAFQLLLAEIEQVCEKATSQSELIPYAQELRGAVESLKKVTGYLLSLIAKKGVEVALADATLFLEMTSIVVIGWQWLLQGTKINEILESSKDSTIQESGEVLTATKTKSITEKDRQFYESKMYTLRYFFGYELPKIEGLNRRLLNSGDAITVEMNSDLFE